MWMLKLITVPHATLLSTWNPKWFERDVPVASAAMFGKEAIASVTVTPEVSVLRVLVMHV
jgi:hypothetical protein